MKSNKSELAAFLQNTRLKANMTQGEVSQKLGYTSPQFISNWERGISAPPIQTLKKLCGYYKVNPDSMFNVLLSTSLEEVETSLKKKFYGAKKVSKN